MIFMIIIGIKIVGSCHPIINARGVRRIIDIINPFTAPLAFNFVVDMKKPAAIQNVKADKFASLILFIAGMAALV